MPIDMVVILLQIKGLVKVEEVKTNVAVDGKMVNKAKKNVVDHQRLMKRKKDYEEVPESKMNMNDWVCDMICSFLIFCFSVSHLVHLIKD